VAADAVVGAASRNRKAVIDVAAPVLCYVGLGSNLDDPSAQLDRAERALAGLSQTRLLRVSGRYRNQPLGDPRQPWFLNAVAELATGLTPLLLLQALKAIEVAQGRVAGARWAPRPIDLDILLYGQAQIRLPQLQIPHPGIAARRFVLLPLAELVPELEVPGLGYLSDLLAKAPPWEIERID